MRRRLGEQRADHRSGVCRVGHPRHPRRRGLRAVTGRAHAGPHDARHSGGVCLAITPPFGGRDRARAAGGVTPPGAPARAPGAPHPAAVPRRRSEATAASAAARGVPSYTDCLPVLHQEWGPNPSRTAVRVDEAAHDPPTTCMGDDPPRADPRRAAGTRRCAHPRPTATRLAPPAGPAAAAAAPPPARDWCRRAGPDAPRGSAGRQTAAPPLPAARSRRMAHLGAHGARGAGPDGAAGAGAAGERPRRPRRSGRAPPAGCDASASSAPTPTGRGGRPLPHQGGPSPWIRGLERHSA